MRSPLALRQVSLFRALRDKCVVRLFWLMDDEAQAQVIAFWLVDRYADSKKRYCPNLDDSDLIRPLFPSSAQNLMASYKLMKPRRRALLR
jgi:hypothetical protein